MNTFQCVLATNGAQSFVIFLYADGLIQWSSGEHSESSNLKAVAGYNTREGNHSFSIPGSGTANIINITQTSNIGVPGVWILHGEGLLYACHAVKVEWYGKNDYHVYIHMHTV